MVGYGLTKWLAEDRSDGRVIVRVGRRAGELVAEFPNLGLVTVTADGNCAHFEPANGLSPIQVEKIQSTLVDAFIRHAQGKLTLHGGSVCDEKKAIAFVGPSRAGKSTLAAALCAGRDLALIGDDTVAIELSEPNGATVYVTSTQKSAWLLPDTRRAFGFDASVPRKTAVALKTGGVERKALGAVMSITFDPEGASPTLRRLHGQEAFSTLFNSAFHFVVDDPTALVREFEQIRAIADQCSIYELRRPRDLRRLGETVDLVRSLLDWCPIDGNAHV